LRERGESGALDGFRLATIPEEVAVVSLHNSRPTDAERGSTSHDGRYLWVQPCGRTHVAGDLEALDGQTAKRMAARFDTSPEAFLRFWTLLETIAKLEDIPADVLLRRHRTEPTVNALSESHPMVRYNTDEIDGLIVTVGWLEDTAGDTE